jgi:hypothetical protein
VHIAGITSQTAVLPHNLTPGCAVTALQAVFAPKPDEYFFHIGCYYSPEFESKNRSVFLADLSHAYSTNGVAKTLGGWLS